MKRRDFLRLVGGASVLAALPVGFAETKKETGVTLENLRQPPLNTTMMGVMKGALDYYKLGVSVAALYGLSGHAFLINIHNEINPSGPYCWNNGPVERLLKNVGIEMSGLGIEERERTPEGRAGVEKRLREALDAGNAYTLLKWENQLITGYDETGFTLAQPWGPKVDVTPGRLTFGTWQELIKDFAPFFHILKAGQVAERRAAILECLDYAVDLHANPGKHAWKGYGIGSEAYDLWIKAVPKFGGSHGNWWNGQVWSECRKMAGQFFTEIQKAYPKVAEAAGELSKLYADIGDALDEASDKKMAAADKVKILADAKEQEAVAIKKVAALAAAFRAA